MTAERKSVLIPLLPGSLSQLTQSIRFRACLFGKFSPRTLDFGSQLTNQDMDGLLINTEDIYTEVTNELLAEHGKGELTWDVKITLQGRPGPEVS